MTLIERLVALRRVAYLRSCAWLRENRATSIFVILAGLGLGSYGVLARSNGFLSTQTSTYIAYVLLLVASLFFAIPNFTEHAWVNLKQNTPNETQRDALEREQGVESAEFATFGILLLIFGFLYQLILIRAA